MSGVAGIGRPDEATWPNESDACICNNRAFISNFGERSRRQQALSQKTANARDAQKSTSPPANADSCAQRRSGGSLPWLPPKVSLCTGEPTKFLMVSSPRSLKWNSVAPGLKWTPSQAMRQRKMDVLKLDNSLIHMSIPLDSKVRDNLLHHRFRHTCSRS